MTRIHSSFKDYHKYGKWHLPRTTGQWIYTCGMLVVSLIFATIEFYIVYPKIILGNGWIALSMKLIIGMVFAELAAGVFFSVSQYLNDYDVWELATKHLLRMILVTLAALVGVLVYFIFQQPHVMHNFNNFCYHLVYNRG